MTPLALAHAMPEREFVLAKAITNICSALKLSQAQLSRVLGLSTATISRLFHGGYTLSEKKKEWEHSVMLVRAYDALMAIVGTEEMARTWFNNKNRDFSEQRPVDIIQTTEGLFRVVTYLESHRDIG